MDIEKVAKDRYKKIGNIVEMVDCTHYEATEKEVASWGFGYYPAWPAGGIIKFRHENGWSEWAWNGELPTEIKLCSVEQMGTNDRQICTSGGVLYHEKV